MSRIKFFNAIVLISFLINLSLVSAATNLCPFTNCTWKYDPNQWYSGYFNNAKYCQINCDASSNIVHGNSTTNNIGIFTLSGIDNIPPNTFNGLSIYQLSLQNNKIQSLPSTLFNGINLLYYLILNGMNQLTNIQTNCFNVLNTTTSSLAIINSNLNDTSFSSMGNEIKKLSLLSILYLNNNKLNNFDGTFLTNLTALSTLYLHYNSITNIYFPYNIPSLSLIYLIGNQLSTINSNMFSNLKNLRSLYLGSNSLSNLDESIILSIPSLYYLDISYNNFNSISLRNTKSITYLILSGNKFSDWSNILLNPSLVYLDLSNNNLTDLQISNLNNLQYLYVASNRISNLNYLWFQNLTNLYGLRLYSNGIKSIESNTFQNLTRLSYLDLSYNQIQDLSFLKPLVSLSQLQLQSNQIKQISENNFNLMPSLINLYLSSNQINQIDYKSFAKNQYLNYLDLSNNYISSPPDISINFNLQTYNLGNQNKNFTIVNDFAFKINQSNTLNLYLTGNNFTQFSNKAFCQINVKTLNIYISSMANINKCQLKQFLFSQTVNIYWQNYGYPQPSCEIINFANYLSINFVGGPTNCPKNNSLALDDCNSQTRYLCSDNQIMIVRKTTYVTGDPHVYSYKKDHQVCTFGKQVLCFSHPTIQIYCNDLKITNAIGSVTQLSSILINFVIDKKINITFSADKSTIGKVFSNQQTVIFDNTPQKNLVVAFLQNSYTNVNNYIKDIFDFRTNTQITITRWDTFYTLLVRSPHTIYQKSTGILVNGCASVSLLNKKFETTTINPKCIAPCQNMSLLSSTEEMNSTIVYDMCTYDCSQTNGNTSFANMYTATVNNANNLTNTDSILSKTNNTAAGCDPNSNTTCNCTYGFTGTFCNIRIYACNSSPCLNGASCLNTTPGNYTCLCSALYTGTNCNTKLPPPCADSLGQYFCQNNKANCNLFGSLCTKTCGLC